MIQGMIPFAASNLRAAVHRRYARSTSPSNMLSNLKFFSHDSGTNSNVNSPVTQSTELTRVPTLVEGCDYEHWFVVMEAPKGYPLRDEIVSGYVKTLAMALGSEEEAKRSIYSVSTKYYYAFGCKVPKILSYMIGNLPNVKWVLPDSYLYQVENNYGGEPFINGEVVPYDAKYHADWIHDQTGENCKTITPAKKSKRKQKKNKI
ncbi:hypothetical protein CFOL_v3_25169 [Cephalotus follicularis]|uniref:MORF/ORRM1/DAG-like MORF domain-containing protein n=1 Tax=Cephalotus follicularis TaxID=3775 RepID=A0A1Q3CNI9_CEPFO|nr:hypothetical protein CFOL_v3_25169 [Cephalotus follicularis]